LLGNLTTAIALVRGLLDCWLGRWRFHNWLESLFGDGLRFSCRLLFLWFFLRLVLGISLRQILLGADGLIYGCDCQVEGVVALLILGGVELAA
jgi:hypothetical protein